MSNSEVYFDIIEERRKQLKYWSPEHDDAKSLGVLAKAGAAYALNDENLWPWDDGWKPGVMRDNLIKAAALIVAEIEKIDRLTDKVTDYVMANKKG